VESDRGELLGLPGLGCVEGEGAWRKRFVGVAGAGKDEAASAGSLVESVVEEFAAEV
jgi:hypothetical protein